MGFPRREYWSGLPSPCLRSLPHPGIEPGPPAALRADSLPSEPPGKPAVAERSSYVTSKPRKPVAFVNQRSVGKSGHRAQRESAPQESDQDPTSACVLKRCRLLRGKQTHRQRVQPNGHLCRQIMTLEILRHDTPLPHTTESQRAVQHSWLQNHLNSQHLKMTHKCARVCVMISQFRPKHLKAPLKECEPLDMADVS